MFEMGEGGTFLVQKHFISDFGAQFSRGGGGQLNLEHFRKFAEICWPIRPLVAWTESIG